MVSERKNQSVWIGIIAAMIVGISLLHYTTPTLKWQYHLIYMQSYFVPILFAAFQFGIKGGLGTAIAISLIYFPHIMLQWGGLVETNLMRFMQILLFNIIGYITGLKAQRENEEKRRYQQAARKLEKSLELLKKQSEELEELEEQVRQADRLAVVGELSASMAHEVRNPLSAIRGAVEILKDELPREKQTTEFLEILLQEIERLNQVVENYLGLARRQAYRKTLFDLREIIRNVHFLLQSRALKESISLKINIPDDPLMVEADPDQVRQILINLVLNALQAMDHPGTVLIEAQQVSSLQNSINVPSRVPSDQKYIHLCVHDQGKGMTPEEIRNIFDPFYTTRADGTGLGLAIVRRIVEQNRWDIKVESEPGKGTRFILKFYQSPEP